MNETLQIPPTMPVVPRENIDRYLDRVAEVWTRMEREGIRRIAEAGKPDDSRRS